MQSTESTCVIGQKKKNVCRRVNASINTELLQAGVVKGLKTLGLLWFWFMANPVIRKVRDLLNE